MNSTGLAAYLRQNPTSFGVFAVPETKQAYVGREEDARQALGFDDQAKMVRIPFNPSRVNAGDIVSVLETISYTVTWPEREALERKAIIWASEGGAYTHREITPAIHVLALSLGVDPEAMRRS
ncbi:MAG: hypothetical protein ABIA93_00260 [Candidatus Woesearchaeota archaeon]